ncbi:MAG: hypothetical protein K8R48_10155 [Alphaproteobacteria bacterium]|nr:hypothetical protein [Alphaproteobacteria bacterium]
MVLITLAFLLAFTALYLSKSLEKKPEFVTKAVEKISANLDTVALAGVVYGLVAAILALIMVSGGGMFLRFVGNILIVLMALPFVFEQQLPKFKEKINPAIIEEIRKVIGKISKQEKYVGYAGAAVSVLLFAIAFS